MASPRDLRVPLSARAKFKVWGNCSSETVITSCPPPSPRAGLDPAGPHAEVKPGDYPPWYSQWGLNNKAMVRGGGRPGQGSQASLSIILGLSTQNRLPKIFQNKAHLNN